MGQYYSKPSFLRFTSHSQATPSPSPSPVLEDDVRLITQKAEFKQTVGESESTEDEEEVVKDSPSVSNDDQTMRTPCVRKPTPTKTTIRHHIYTPHPHDASYDNLDGGSDLDSRFSSPIDVVLPQHEKPTSSKSKRCLFPEVEKDAREKKKAKVVEEEAPKKKYCSKRLWSEEDEVVILEGLIDYKNNNGADTYPDMGEFHEFIKESLSFSSASENQFLDKVRKLRRKYTNNVAKGEEALLSKPHEHKCLELSRRIWGDGGGGDAVSTSSTKARRKIALMGEKAEELEKKWQIWHADEAALRLRQGELIEEQKKLMLDLMNASKEYG